MSRKHLFAVVVLLGAAAVAGLLAVTRTVDLGTAATSASATQIAARSRSLDQLEASLRRSLAKRPPVVASTKRAAASLPAQRTVFVRAAAPSVGTATAEHEDEQDGNEHESEYASDHESEHEGDRGNDD